MADTTKQQGVQGQADKQAAEEKTAEQERERQQRADEASSAAAKVLQVDAADAVNPYPAYDLMTLDQLRSLAEERGVEVNRDVERAHLITELRAADTGTVSPAVRRGAR